MQAFRFEATGLQTVGALTLNDGVERDSPPPMLLWSRVTGGRTLTIDGRDVTAMARMHSVGWCDTAVDSVQVIVARLICLASAIRTEPLGVTDDGRITQRVFLDDIELEAVTAPATIPGTTPPGMTVDVLVGELVVRPHPQGSMG